MRGHDAGLTAFSVGLASWTIGGPMIPRSTRLLIEKRMRDVRQHQQRPLSGAQVGKQFRVAQQALGDLSTGLMLSYPDLAAQVDEISGVIRSIEKQVEP